MDCITFKKEYIGDMIFVKSFISPIYYDKYIQRTFNKAKQNLTFYIDKRCNNG